MSKKDDQLFMRDEAMDEIRKIPNYAEIMRARHERTRNTNHKPIIIKQSAPRSGMSVLPTIDDFSEEPSWIGKVPDEPHSQQTQAVCASCGSTFDEKAGVDVSEGEVCCCAQCAEQYELIYHD